MVSSLIAKIFMKKIFQFSRSITRKNFNEFFRGKKKNFRFRIAHNKKCRLRKTLTNLPILRKTENLHGMSYVQIRFYIEAQSQLIGNRSFGLSVFFSSFGFSHTSQLSLTGHYTNIQQLLEKHKLLKGGNCEELDLIAHRERGYEYQFSLYGYT